MNERTVKDNGPDGDFDPFAPCGPLELRPIPGQAELWLSSRSDPGASRALNESFLISLEGNIDDVALRNAISALPSFHEALRGRFSPDGERFLIDPELTPRIDFTDVSGLSPEARESELARIAKNFAETAFDLDNGPLFRAAVAVHNAGQHVFLGAHHSVCDGWSLDVLLMDLGRLYTAFSGASGLPMPPAHGFSDYIAFCASDDYRSRVETSRVFWRRALQPLPPPLEFRHDRPRPALRSYGARHGILSISRETMNACKETAKAAGLNFFPVLLSAYASLIYKLSGTTDFLIGIPVAGHPGAGMEDCVGHLVNLSPVRFTVNGETTFGELCEQANRSVLDAVENAPFGFGEIVSDLKVPRDPSRVPLISAVFTHVQKYAQGKLRFGNASVDYRLNPRSFETFELNFNVLEASNGITVMAHGNAGLFSQEWVDARLLEFGTILTEGCARPGMGLDGFSVSAIGGVAAQSASLPAGGISRGTADARDLPSIERKIRDIWADKLGHADFTDESGFLDVGGNSLIAFRIVMEMEKAFGEPFPLTVLFQYPTVKALARSLVSESAGSGENSLAQRIANRRKDITR